MAISVFTEWNTPLEGSEPDLARHDAYTAFALATVEKAMPLLLCFLSAADAQVIAGTHMFSFSLPTVPGVWHDMPEMAGRLNLLPWAEAHETAH